MVIFYKNDLRVSLILPTLMRVEKGHWTDLPTQSVFCRHHGNVPYALKEEGEIIVNGNVVALIVAGEQQAAAVEAFNALFA